MDGAQLDAAGELELAGQRALPRRGGSDAERVERGATRLAPAARALLVGSQGEVLARLTAHDPLRVRALVGRRIAERYLLLDAQRVHLASLARIARGARRYRGNPSLERWLEREVDAAIDATLAEELELDRSRALEPRVADSGSPRDDAREVGAWAELARPLGLPPRAMRSACARFNALPSEEREAFVQLVLERRSPDELARASGRTLTELARRARRGVEAVLASGAEPEREEKVRTS